MIPTSFFLWANDHFADFCLKESHCFDERSKDAETRLCPLGATCGETDGWASRRGGLWRWFGFRSQRIQRFFLYEFVSFIVLLFLFDLINVLHFIENMNPWEEVSKMTDPRRSHWICMCGRSYMLHWPRPEACGVLRISPASLKILVSITCVQQHQDLRIHVHRVHLGYDFDKNLKMRESFLCCFIVSWFLTWRDTQPMRWRAKGKVGSLNSVSNLSRHGMCKSFWAPQFANTLPFLQHAHGKTVPWTS